MRKKKNRFLLFWFSLLPGAGELYLGFMKTGLSLISVFGLSVMLTSFVGWGVLSVISFVIWLYGFFHANNLGALSDEEFYRVEDEYFFGLGDTEVESVKKTFTGKYRKGFAVLLILMGISMLWETVCRGVRLFAGNEFYNMYFLKITNVINNEMPRTLIAVVVILFGIKLIQGKRAELEDMERKNEQGGLRQDRIQRDRVCRSRM